MRKIIHEMIAGLLLITMGLMCVPESIRKVVADEVQELKSEATMQLGKTEAIKLEKNDSFRQ